MMLPYTFDENDIHGDLHPTYADNGPCRILQDYAENMSIFVRIKVNVLVTFIQSKLYN
jgi:hypothetical protein